MVEKFEKRDMARVPGSDMEYKNKAKNEIRRRGRKMSENE